MKLKVIEGGRQPHADRVLHPRTALSARAGITPVMVPGDMYVAPELISAMKAPRALRAVA